MARGADDLKPTDIAISEATGDAVHAAGKQVYVSHMLGRGQPTINGWGNVEAAEFIPLRLVPELEKMATGQPGWPHITRALARMQGFELFRLPEIETDAGNWLTQIGAMSSEAAEITAKICAALADDQKVCARDVRQHALIDDAEQLVALAVQLLAQLRAVEEGA
ncbi:hypothetical protein N5J77_01950 [Sphingobium yanoikuyae]|uniref:Uncharacterized protein n=1 Tax=Sphingobium yanoikuyae TaxID=13690 RepID=A0A3G2V0M6_SPHYA|nr:hypothetical protein [Sphingobium yanoikuyae]AYO78339.1 hypothetical protein EBF16_16450 [Sphingobium yanoikuyae]MDH2129871.1 hypothetical protein [Sphingobium yanoikuyae]MDH2147865.1 hypothetical protein [Sphingobium yanoikuyae]MDH2165134.1 hypothetical protein [Sphingobium yanoikuyae]